MFNIDFKFSAKDAFTRYINYFLDMLISAIVGIIGSILVGVLTIVVYGLPIYLLCLFFGLFGNLIIDKSVNILHLYDGEEIDTDVYKIKIVKHTKETKSRFAEDIRYYVAMPTVNVQITNKTNTQLKLCLFGVLRYYSGYHNIALSDNITLEKHQSKKENVLYCEYTHVKRKYYKNVIKVMVLNKK